MTALSTLILRLPHVRLPDLSRWYSAASERRALAALTDSELADIGLTEADVAAEIARPFWDLNRR